jgi:hypothetical protein
MNDHENTGKPALARADLTFCTILKTEGEIPALDARNLDRLVNKWDRNSQVTRPWCGWLQKRCNLVSWQPHWFHLSACDDGMRSGCAVITYHSDVKGERRLLIESVRREAWLDSGDSIAFSVGVVQSCSGKGASIQNGLLRWSGRGKRVQLRAASSVEAACFCICLLRILHPDRTLPTMTMAANTPKRLLRTLFEAVAPSQEC